LPENLEGFKESLRMFYLFTEKFEFTLKIEDVSRINVIFPEIRALKNDHLKSYNELIVKEKLMNQMNAFSFIVSEKANHVLYTSDLQSTSFLDDFLEKLSVLIVDGLHPSPKELLNIIDRFTGKLILTHGISKELANELNKISNNKYIVAEDDYAITL
jgi:hypothetical protein